jgi:hypothetical protein
MTARPTTPHHPDSATEETSDGPGDAAACCPREPLRVSYSRDELAAKMAEWMLATWGHPMDLTEASRDRWMERGGMLYAFICDHFPGESDCQVNEEQ